MAENTTPATPIPTLPKVPKQDVWGNDVPLPNGGVDSEIADAVVESVSDLAEKNAEIFQDVVTQFQRYTESIKASNQNFLLKQGRLLLLNIKRGVIEGLVENAEKNETLDSEYLYELMDTAGRNLERLIQGQDKANALEMEAQETDQERAIEEKNHKAKESEQQRESWLKKFFTGGDSDKKKIKGKDDGGGLIDSLLDKFAFVIPAVKLLIPLLGGLSLFFVDFEKLLKNPMWEKISKLIQEKLIPGIAYLFENVIGPLADFLFNTTLPAVAVGLIEAFDDIVVFVQDIIDAFKADSWEEGLDKGIKALARFLANVGETLLNFTLEAVGIDSDAWKEMWKRDWEILKTNLSNMFGETITGYFKSIGQWLVDTVDPVEQEKRAIQARKDWKERWEKIKSFWNNSIDSITKSLDYISSGWNELTNNAYVSEGWAKDWENTKNLWKSRWDSLTGATTGLINGISSKWNEITNDAYVSKGFSQDWEDTKAKWAGWKAKITEKFWGFIDTIADSIGTVFKDLGEYFVALPGRIWKYIMDTVRGMLPESIGNLMLGEVTTPAQYVDPVRNIMMEDAAKKANMDGGAAIGNMLSGVDKFGGAASAFREDARRRDTSGSGAAPVIITAPTNQNVQTNYGGPSYMAPTRTGNERSLFGAK